MPFQERRSKQARKEQLLITGVGSFCWRASSACEELCRADDGRLPGGGGLHRFPVRAGHISQNEKMAGYISDEGEQWLLTPFSVHGKRQQGAMREGHRAFRGRRWVTSRGRYQDTSTASHASPMPPMKVMTHCCHVTRVNSNSTAPTQHTAASAERSIVGELRARAQGLGMCPFMCHRATKRRNSWGRCSTLPLAVWRFQHPILASPACGIAWLPLPLSD